MKRICLTVLAVVACITASQAQSAPANQTSPQATASVLEIYGKLPLSFEPNQGQADPQVKFLSRGTGYNLFLTPTEAVLALQKPTPRKSPKSTTARQPASPASILTMKLVGGNPTAKITGSDQQPGKSNYFIGNDPAKWHTNISNYSQVNYKDVYPGVDLVYYGNQRKLEHDFIVAPGANPKAITLAFLGARRISLNANGDLVLATKDGEVQLKQPILYQQIAGIKQPVPGRYILKSKNRVGFAIATYNHRQPLVIDPVLVYATYLGPTNVDRTNVISGIAIDASGSAYVTGYTGPDYPTTPGAFQTTFVPGNDLFVSKLNPAGSALVYSTFISGGNETGAGIAVDAAGNAYVTGNAAVNGSATSNFPTTPGAYRTTITGCCDGFVTKLNANGSALVYSTFLGGAGGEGIAIDVSGNAYVTGIDGLVTVRKLNATGSALLYSFDLGTGLQESGGYAIAIDALGNAYVTGFTQSSNFPTTPGAFQPTFGGGDPNGGDEDAFVFKLNAAGSALVYSTYLGGSGDDLGAAIAVDSAGDAYVTGFTGSTNFPVTPGAFQTAFAGRQTNAFVSKLNPTGSALLYSTYLGGGDDRGQGIAVNASGNAYVTGFTDSADFPITPDPIPVPPGSGAFVSKLNAAGSGLLYSTLVAGRAQGSAIAIDASGNAYVAGITLGSTLLTTPGAFQTISGSSSDVGFVAKISDSPDVTRADLAISIISTSHTAIPGENIDYAITLQNLGPDASIAEVIDILPPQTTFVSCQADAGGICANTGNTVTITFPSIANAHSAFITLVAQVGATVPGGSIILDDATVLSLTTDPDTTNNSSDVSTVVRYISDLSIQDAVAVSPGSGQVQYLISVTAPVAATSNGVTVSDPLPAGTTFVSATSSQGTCTNPAVGAHGTVTCNLGQVRAGHTPPTISLTVNAASGTTISNTATVTALTFDPNPANNSITVTTTVP